MSESKKTHASVCAEAADDCQCLSGIFDNLKGLFRALSDTAEKMEDGGAHAGSVAQIKRLANLGELVAEDWANTADHMRSNYVHAASTEVEHG